MVRSRRLRLSEGSYRHHVCPDCVEPPPQKQYTATDRRWILRRRWCHQRLVDFSIVLQLNECGVWCDVVRFSIAHANQHEYQYYRDSKRIDVRTAGLLHTVDDVEEAYRVSVRTAYTCEQKYLDQWRRAS